MSAADLTKACQFADALSTHLRHVADGDDSYASGAWNALYDLRRIADSLTSELDARVGSREGADR